MSLTAKVQSVLLSLPSHPRCEALAYQARSHFQAYYGLMIRSLEDAAERPGQPYLRWNPLRVIRWRKQVLAEEKRRQNWDASVNEQIKSHHRLVQSTEDDGIPRDGWESQMPESIGRAGSRLQQMSKVISPPLRSATALSRALASDPQAAMALRKSATFREWLVLPSEILAFIDCRGNVDYFVPATDKAQDVLRTAMASASYPQSDGLPLSRATKSAFPSQQGLSPGSYGSSQGNISTVSFDSEILEHVSRHRSGRSANAFIDRSRDCLFRIKLKTACKNASLSRGECGPARIYLDIKATPRRSLTTVKDSRTYSRARLMLSGGASFTTKAISSLTANGTSVTATDPLTIGTVVCASLLILIGTKTDVDP